MLTGAHAIIFSRNPDADRRFFKEVLKLPNVDAGEGWLIFALPASEVAIHPSDDNDRHALYLMCDNIDEFVATVKTHGLRCSRIQQQAWGRLTELTLPSGGKLGVYQPQHKRPRSITHRTRARVVQRSRKKTVTRAGPRRR